MVDFNLITLSSEHKGSNFNYYVRKALSFSNFISGKSPDLDEVYNAIFSLHDGKSPDLDDLNVEFFKYFWKDLINHLISGMSYFFDKVGMPKACGQDLHYSNS